ncbi:universal stress protein [Saccharomonospora azurea]|uniref:Universal stress protein UspA-like protein n=1 Tax=Saccharomonospora azurea NA-128 TaxID=882081 RepID=H8GEC0_9PSEU|nr:universal stress protein [Saccharomonospora azurea]EHK80245.1 universal stress protein UspA-like protein [Saccharomonospora azurea SZMC 14600]EHY87915.1 universal stress protein UspA-like protein [Saccharomonospora azurea NA-128]
MPGDAPTDGTIVVGIDGSPASRQALRWACYQAEITGGSVLALSVREESAFLPGSEFALRQRGSWRSDEAVRAALHRTVSLVSTSAPVRERVVSGQPADELLAAAHDADLLVLGTDAHRGLSAVPLGGVAVECVRRAVCPLVLVPAAPAR